MADFSKFRTALNGFKRSDVTQYIETLCAGHQKELKAAREEAAELSRQLDARTAQCDTLQKELDDTRTALEATQNALEEAMEALTQPEEAPATEPVPDYTGMELEAYRRAEAAERAAQQSVAKLCNRLDDLMDRTSGRYEQSGQEIQALAMDIRNNLSRLEETLSDLDAIFDETKNGIDAMAEDFTANT